VVSTEQMRSGFILEGERETHLHRVAFRTLTEAALSPADSRSSSWTSPSPAGPAASHSGRTSESGFPGDRETALPRRPVMRRSGRTRRSAPRR
jgi:hypothetical protein